MATKQKVEKKFGFTLDYEGFINLLLGFAPIWDAFKLLVGGPVGSTPEADDLIHRRDTFMRYAEPMFKGQLDTFELTICTGAMLKLAVEKYIKETLGIHDINRVNEFFDKKCAEIEKLSPEIWAAKMNEIGESRVRFSAAVKENQMDLVEVVKAYNGFISIVIPIITTLKAEAKKREDAERARRQKEKADREAAEKREMVAREQRERMKRLHAAGEGALNRLMA